MPSKRLIFLLCVLLLGGIIFTPTHAQSDKPFILPIAAPAGPNSWLIGQFYGNTVDAYNYQQVWYATGQGLHFGLDFFAPCGTPLVAVADGEVKAVDAPSFGAYPHNLVLVHSQHNLVSLYGHLSEMPLVIEGQPVRQGEVIGVSGDPDGECESRPHLHFEVRSMDFKTTYNPVDFIEAPWHSLAMIGTNSQPQFERDLYNPRRWMNIDDQPPVTFGENRLNIYNRAYPPTRDIMLADPAVPLRQFEPLPLDTQWTLRPLTEGGCCPYPWWDETDSNRFYVMDGEIDNRADVVAYQIGEPLTTEIIQPAPPDLLSPDGTHQIYSDGAGHYVVYNRLTDESWQISSSGQPPALSTDNSRLLWMTTEFRLIPSEPFPKVEIFVSNKDGSQLRKIWEQEGGEARWLDEARLLIITPHLDSAEVVLTVFDTRDDRHFMLGTWDWLRELTVAPGGGRLMFYLIWQTDPTLSGVYTIPTQQGAQAELLPWFGGWRWRDADSVYFIPFTQSIFNGGKSILGYYHLPTQNLQYLTNINLQPFTIANTDWVVSPDGNRILFRSAEDLNLWLLERIQ